MWLFGGRGGIQVRRRVVNRLYGDVDRITKVSGDGAITIPSYVPDARHVHVS